VARETPPLAGQVAVVAGATRGAGRGIARALAEAGAFVYCTGRSAAGRPLPRDRKRQAGIAAGQPSHRGPDLPGNELVVALAQKLALSPLDRGHAQDRPYPATRYSLRATTFFAAKALSSAAAPH